MMRDRARIGCAVALLAGAIACNGSEVPSSRDGGAPSERSPPPAPAPHEAREAYDSVTLTEARPAGNVTLDAALLESPALRYDVVDVRNPDRRELSIAVALRMPGSGEVRPLGAVSLFPPDQGGTFTLRLPDELRREAADADANPVIVFRMEPTAAAGATRSVTITGLRDGS